MVFYKILSLSASGLHQSIEFTPNEQRIGNGVLVIACGNKESRYHVSEFPTEGEGRAFRLLRTDGAEVHSVFLGRTETHQYHCNCEGFSAGDHCSHLDALVVLRDEGWLDISLVNPEADVSNTEAGDQQEPPGCTPASRSKRESIL